MGNTLHIYRKLLIQDKMFLKPKAGRNSSQEKCNLAEPKKNPTPLGYISIRSVSLYLKVSCHSRST